MKGVLLVGLAADALSMTLPAWAAGLIRDRALVCAVLLSAAGCLSLGFAVVTPVLNLLAPQVVDRAVLIVNALLGSAAAIAPLLLVGRVDFGVWWALRKAEYACSRELPVSNSRRVGFSSWAWVRGRSDANKLADDERPQRLKRLNAAISLGRMAKPEEIASIVTFLAGDGAGYLTATTIFADGGMMQQSPGL